MGFKVDVQPSMQGLEAVNSTITHSVEAMKAVVPYDPRNPYDIPELRQKPETPYERIMREHEEAKQVKNMQTEQMQVEKFEVPEPLMVHKPTQVDSSVTIQNLNVQSSGTPDDVQRAITRAMAGITNQQSGNVNSALND